MKPASTWHRCLLPGTRHPPGSIIIDPTEFQSLPKASFAVRLNKKGGWAIKRVFQTEAHKVLMLDNPECLPLALEKGRNSHFIIGRVIWSWTSWAR